jgi:hypothetical protein
MMSEVGQAVRSTAAAGEAEKTPYCTGSIDRLFWIQLDLKLNKIQTMIL